MLILLCLLLCALPAFAEKLSPFQRVEPDDAGKVRVRYDDRAYVLIAIDGFKTADLMKFCRERYKERANATFALKLSEVLTAVRNRKQSGPVSLVLQREETGERISVSQAPMTRANWRKVFWARQGYGKPIEPLRFDRKITRAEALADLRQVEKALLDRFAYLTLGKGQGAPATLPEGSGAVTVGQLTRAIARTLARYDDPNTRVAGVLAALPGRFLPFSVRPVGDRFVAIDRDGKRLLNPLAPYIAALDSRRPSDWLRALRPFLPDGTVGFQRHVGAALIAKFDGIRKEARTSKKGSVWITLESGDREVRVRYEAILSGTPMEPPAPPRTTIRMLDGGIAYVRLPHMENEATFRRQVEPILPDLEKSRALVLDLRGNRSTNREILRLVLPRLLPKDAKPRVVNVAKCRVSGNIARDDPDGYLSEFGMHPVHWSGWGATRREIVLQFMTRFEPDWKPSGTGFSGWHVMVVGRGEEEVYGRPVVVLVDGATRNAAEVMAYAMKGLDHVTLLGEPTGGSDGGPVLLALKHSNIHLWISTIASYRTDGRLFLGNSVALDRTVERIPTDWTGQTDSQLAAALKLLGGK